ncbi:MAG TPA: adenylate/guanylate cyclase domain-containing protein [Anaerolineales bacterium]|nr:adenylate/guanylate cyclase domain-containing protein [Anaerolineales bacterium]
MSSFPSGTVTFLFTDIEGSTRLARQYPGRWEAARARHHAILRAAIEAHNGYVFQIIGDAFCAAFHTAGDAVRAAAKAQIDLHAEAWGDVLIKVRMGIHTGKAEIQENGEYHGYLAMSRIQRLMSAGHGGQVLISAATQELLLEDLPEDVSLRDLGERRLKDLIRPEHIYQLILPGLPIDFPPLKTLDLYRHNLPVQLTSFIGREKEIEEIKESISAHRLVTLTGVGGTGKTRLGLQAAAEMLDQFRDGVWFVELASMSDPNLISQAIVSCLGIPEQSGQTILQVLLDALRAKKLLLVLDNCEHLIAACAELVDNLLSNAPSVKIIATSREALGVPGELIWHVPSLSLPDVKQAPTLEQFSQYEAVQLFIERAALVQPHFLVTNDNAPAIAQICFRLDGIPLAIELAAARVKGLSPEQIASRLDDRFRLLTGGSRTALPRQRTLQATIDWSYRLLSEEEQMLLRRLSVFASGWTLEAAEQVCARDKPSSDQILDLLLMLVDKSLVIAKTQGASPRYYMLETIRQYAQEKLDESGESTPARNRHLEYFRSLAEQARPHFQDGEQFAWLDRFETELDNVRTALTWALQGGSVEAGLRLAIDLTADVGAFWFCRGHLKEGHEFLEQLLTRSQETSRIEVLAAGSFAAAVLAWWLHDLAASDRYARQSESLWSQLGPSGKVKAAAARFLKISNWSSGYDPIQVRREYQEILQLFREADDRWMMAHTLYGIAAELHESGNLMDARQTLEQSLSLFQECGDGIRAGNTNVRLAIIAMQEGKYTETRMRCEATLPVFRQLQLPLRDEPLWILGLIAVMEGNYTAAKAWYTECLLFDQEIGFYHQLAECLLGFASIAGSEKRFERAAQLLGAAQSAVEARPGFPLESFDQAELQHLTEVLRAELNESKFEALTAEGRALPMEQAIALALETNHA